MTAPIDLDGPPANAAWAKVGFSTFRKQLRQIYTLKETQRRGLSDEDITLWWQGEDHQPEPVDFESEITGPSAQPRIGSYFARIRDVDPARDHKVIWSYLRAEYRGANDTSAMVSVGGDASYLRALETSAARRETQLLATVEHAERRAQHWQDEYDKLHAKYVELKETIAEGEDEDSGAEWIPTVELGIRVLSKALGFGRKERAVRRFFAAIQSDPVLVRRLRTRHADALLKLFAAIKTRDDEEDLEDEDEEEDELEGEELEGVLEDDEDENDEPPQPNGGAR